jgi:ribonuclease P protein component
VARYGFPSRYKLLKTDEFSSVFSFRRRIFGECLAMYYQPNRLGHPRLGIVISRKTARRAVARNYMRRVLREWFRLNQEKLGGLDLVVKVQKPYSRTDFCSIQEELQRLSGRLQRESTKGLEKTDGAHTDLAG